MNLRDALERVVKSKHNNDPAATAGRRGQTTFAECRSLLESGLLSNKANRDEDLDSSDKYENKVNHLIRFLMGISEKGELMVSIIKNTPSNIGYIRDNGTLFSLLFGEYFDHKELTGDKWIEMCGNIITEYDITNESDKYVTNLITNLFTQKTDQLSSRERALKTQKYSLKYVVNSCSEFKTLFDNKEMSYVVSLHTTKQFGKDMINCNRQPNPWLAYNYYMTPLKQGNLYYEHFCGDKLLEYFTNKDGTDTFSRGGLMSGYAKFSEKHKVAKMVPVLQAYIGSHFCKNLHELKTFNDMVVDFENGKSDGKVLTYWSEKFNKILDVSYQDMVSFYEKSYLPAFEMKDSWGNITNKISEIKESNFKNSKITAWEDLHIRKYHTGILMMTFAIYFSNRFGKGKIADAVNRITESYSQIIDKHEILVDQNTSVKFYEYFGKRASQYGSTSANKRWEHLFKHVFNNVNSHYKNRKADRDKQSEFRNNVLTRCESFLEREKLTSRMTFYPLSVEELRTVNFATGDGLHWLHKTPHSTGGNAEDGFLGMMDDNLSGNQKYKTWNCTPNEYWERIIDHNETLSGQLEGNNKKLVQRSIDIMLALISNVDMGA
jgi:hypothetical protein